MRRAPRPGEAEPFGFGQVDVVETGAAQCDQLGAAVVQLPQHLLIEPVIDERADAPETCGQRCGFRRQRWFEVDQLVPRSLICLIEKKAIVGFAAEYRDAHGHLLRKGLRAALVGRIIARAGSANAGTAGTSGQSVEGQH